MNPSTTIPSQFAIETAHNIGRKLCKEAIWVNECCTWQGASLVSNRGREELVYRTFGPDLRSGLAGIALFLAELLVEVKDAVIEATLEAAVKNLLQQIQKMKENPSFGFYTGHTGIGYALWKLGLLRGKEEWSNAGLDFLEPLFEAQFQENELDVESGVAGAIPVFLKLYETKKDQRYLDLASRCGDYLLERAYKEAEHWSWPTSSDQAGAIGYVRGAGGIALALLELSQHAKGDQFRSAAMMGFAYENSHFDARQNNWLDPGFGIGSTHYKQSVPYLNESWYNGAPGIALSRLRAYQITGDADLLQEARVALDTTCNLVAAHLKNPAGTNYSLGNGLAGNAEILMEGGRLLNDSVYTQVAQQVARLGVMLYDHTDTDWPSGVTNPGSTTIENYPAPGLLLGLAGTGHFYLHLSPNRKRDGLLMISLRNSP